MNAHEHRNEVHLVGRVSRQAVVNRLPSGDPVANLWVVVKRPPLAQIRQRRQSVDTLELVAWKAPVQDIIAELRANDLVAVSGALRHRFWQGVAGLRSKYEVELDDAVLLHRPEPSTLADEEPATEPAAQTAE